MCGRFTLTIDPAQLQAIFQAQSPSDLTPRFNVAPSQAVAVIANRAEPRAIELFRWGLIPAWADDVKIGNRLINARAETVAEKPSFRAALKRRRCLVLADGFYEWRKTGKTKTPMYIQLADGAPFAFAGLWETWTAHDQAPIHSCTLITTTPNTLMATIHDRMPVILPPEAYATWLAPTELPAEKTLPLLQPYPAEAMRAHAVSTLVNNPLFDSRECVLPV